MDKRLSAAPVRTTFRVESRTKATKRRDGTGSQPPLWKRLPHGWKSIKIRAAQIKPALRTLHLAPALPQLRRAVRTILPRIGRLHSRPMSALIRYRCRCLFLAHTHEPYPALPPPANADVDSAADETCDASIPTLRRAFTHGQRSPAPAVGHQPPHTQPPPHLHILPALGHHRTVCLAHHD
jgi:hypothetical protein